MDSAIEEEEEIVMTPATESEITQLHEQYNISNLQPQTAKFYTQQVMT